ncbi:LysR family transcriptional regulator [Iodobacter arcticus]|uniref:LysR family transcriptional regulator n=1 Tax=Iodobacter arcticus TaxID=590593 RepID=A0ABW2QSF5_9NEIS
MINSSQLKALCAVIEQGGVSAAANTLFCVPSNITKKIKELESEFGLCLFHRERNRLILTAEGRTFYQKAQEYLALHAQGRSLFYDEPIVGELRIGALDIALSHHLPEPIAHYRIAHPEIKLNIVHGHSLELERQLQAGELDLIFSDGPIEHPLMGGVLAFTEQLVLVGAEPVEIPKQTLYAFPSTCHYRHLIEASLNMQGIRPQTLLEIESYPIIFALIQAGKGCAFIPRSLAEAQGVPHYSEPIQSNIYALWRKGAICHLGSEFIEKVTNVSLISDAKNNEAKVIKTQQKPSQT